MLLLWSLLLVLSRAALLPSEDPFYEPPAWYESADVGSILRWRQLDSDSIGAFIFREDLQAVYQLLFKTVDAQGGPNVAVTTVLVPHNADMSKVVSRQVFIDASDVDCSASYAFQVFANIDTIFSQSEIAYLDGFLGLGYVVNMPDHGSVSAAFVANRMAGHVILDSLKALYDSESITGVPADSQVFMSGYSGGAMVTEWAAELQPSYFPELNLIGIAVGGNVPDLPAIINHVNGTPFSGFLVPALLGLYRQYPGFRDAIHEFLKPEYFRQLARTSRQCLVLNLASWPLLNLWDWFTIGENALQDERVKATFDDNRQGRWMPQVPMLMYHAQLDEVAPYEPVLELYQNYCARGANIELHAELVGDHVTSFVTSLPLMMKYTKDRFDGVEVSPGCLHVEHLSNALPPQYWCSGIRSAKAVLAALKGLPVGPYYGSFGEPREQVLDENKEIEMDEFYQF